MPLADKNSQAPGRVQSPLFAAISAIAARALRNFRKPRATRRLQLVETLPLGGKRQLMLIACDGRNFLVGAGADAVSTITAVEAHVIAHPADPDSSLISHPSNAAHSGSFLQ